MVSFRFETLNDVSSITEIWEEAKLTRSWNNSKMISRMHSLRPQAQYYCFTMRVKLLGR